LIEVKVRENETLEQALRRFRRKIRKEGLMQEIRSRMAYEKPSEKRRRKARLAARRAGKQQEVEARRTSTLRQPLFLRERGINN